MGAAEINRPGIQGDGVALPDWHSALASLSLGIEVGNIKEALEAVTINSSKRIRFFIMPATKTRHSEVVMGLSQPFSLKISREKASRS